MDPWLRLPLKIITATKHKKTKLKGSKDEDVWLNFRPIKLRRDKVEGRLLVVLFSFTWRSFSKPHPSPLIACKTILCFTLEAKLISSKHLIQVHLEILSRSVENMASYLLKKYITWNKSCQSLRSLESWNRCACTSCTRLKFCYWSSVLSSVV